MSEQLKREGERAPTTPTTTMAVNAQRPEGYERVGQAAGFCGEVPGTAPHDGTRLPLAKCIDGCSYAANT